ncbi:hypothetical protein EYC80_008648 [Monilinia laxa]|uniref:Uncharacterized protein n=1 Tax=Monilinia laxa TaxID=61186 RepID=A0A5N6K0Z0_MONLA|nr:hypothetical protein EYC80_008648 [Monilinia laxa]
MHFTKSALIITSLLWANTIALPIDSVSTINLRAPKGVSTAGDIVGEVAKGIPGPAGAIVGTVGAGLKAGGGKGAVGAGGAGGGKGAAGAAGAGGAAGGANAAKAAKGAKAAKAAS